MSAVLHQQDAARAAATERAEAVKRRVLELIPEAVPNLIKPFFEAGLIQGWRNVLDCYPAMGRLDRRSRMGGEK